jgi:hypothetical protein
MPLTRLKDEYLEQDGGGRSRTRTYDPLIKSQLSSADREATARARKPHYATFRSSSGQRHP